MKRITLAVIDSYYLIRHCIGEALVSMGLHVIVRAEDYNDFIRQTKQQVPDICFVETIAPTSDYSEIIGEIRKRFPAIKIVGYTLSENEYVAREHPGIDLFVSKDCDAELIQKRIVALASELKCLVLT